MKFTNKHFKLKKTKTYFKKESIFFIYTSNNLNSKDELKLKQTLTKNHLTSLNIKNNLAKNFIKKSIFKNFSAIMKSSICLVKINNEQKIEKTIKTLMNLHNSLTLIGIKINNKIYSTNQITNLHLLNYYKNLINFTKTLNTLVKIPYYKLKKTESK